MATMIGTWRRHGARAWRQEARALASLSVPNAFIMEYCVEPSEISRALAKNPIAIVEGHGTVPEEPGLGVEPDPAIIDKYLVRSTEADR